MGVKITKDGITYECKTVEEAAQLGMRLSGIKIRNRRPISLNGNDNDVLLKTHGRKLFEILKEAENGLTSQEIGTRLEIGMQSIPPLILGLRRRARAQGKDLDDYLIREKSHDKGKPISTYKLTEEGKKLVSQ